MMDIKQLKQLFPSLEASLYNELIKHGTFKEVKAGEPLTIHRNSIEWVNKN